MTTKEFTDLIDFILQAIETNRQIATPSNLDLVSDAIGRLSNRPDAIAALCEATNSQFNSALSTINSIQSFLKIEKAFISGNDKKIVSLLTQLKKSPNILAVLARFA